MIVYPSGFARAAISAPITPPAPDRLSTMNCWPNSALRRAAKMRATMSVPPPGASGTIMRTVFSGQRKACACGCDNAPVALSSTPRSRIAKPDALVARMVPSTPFLNARARRSGAFDILVIPAFGARTRSSGATRSPEQGLRGITQYALAAHRIDARGVQGIRELGTGPLHRARRVVRSDHHLSGADESEQQLQSGSGHEYRIVEELLDVFGGQLPVLRAELAIEPP